MYGNRSQLPTSETYNLPETDRPASHGLHEGNQSDEDGEFLKFILQHNELKKFIPMMESFITPSVAVHFSAVAKTVDEAVTISKLTVSQTSAYWLLGRRIRITGSVSYNLFTYANNKAPNWENKLNSIYDSNFKGNDATRYGQQAEKIAISVYGKYCLYFKTGLMVSPDLPFLAVSPDGIVFDGCSWKLVEIKAPVLGKKMIAQNAIRELKYLELQYGKYTLKQHHPYFGQIQMGLAILNLTTCDLVIFCGYNESYEIINVDRNESFIEMYIKKLCIIYFEIIMPYFITKKIL